MDGYAMAWLEEALGRLGTAMLMRGSLQATAAPNPVGSANSHVVNGHYYRDPPMSSRSTLASPCFLLQ